jgi:2-polyprenyl-6-methoxyphenol hydroxylase-like FAD-dependent oxidoreductase
VGALAGRELHTAVVGGGPAGLFYATLAKRRFPQHEVVVYERNPPDATFGFGVVLSDRTLSGLCEADPDLHAGLVTASVGWEDIEVRRRGERLRCGGHGFSAISRKRLLLLLQDRAQAAGVDLRFEAEATGATVRGSDLVLAADGVNSLLRDQRAPAFRPRFSTGAARYIWFATPQPFDALTFIFAEDRTGHWGVHAYPFEDGTSTFIVETDERTWRRAGLDGAGDLPPGQSDIASLRYCERLFADHLGGHGLLENNSKWLRFRTLRCGSWRNGNVVLAGDAAHTAHFSVGSGTKMAMEDAVALADAVAVADDLPAALAGYERTRRPTVERIQAAARPSLVWWERFRYLADRSDEQFGFHFLTRSPAVGRARLRTRDRRFVRRVERWHAEATGGSAAAGPLATPFVLGALRLPSRLVVAAPEHREPLVALGGPALGGAGLVLAQGGGDVGEAAAWVRTHTPAAVGLMLAAPAERDRVEEAAAAGFDALAVTGASGCAEIAAAWPPDRTLLVTVPAPAAPEGTEGDDLLAALARLAAGRLLVAGVAPCCHADGPDTIAQLILCDRLREEANLPTLLVDGAADADAAATAVLAGRADLVQAAPSLVSEVWRPDQAVARAQATARRATP